MYSSSLTNGEKFCEFYSGGGLITTENYARIALVTGEVPLRFQYGAGHCVGHQGNIVAFGSGTCCISPSNAALSKCKCVVVYTKLPDEFVGELMDRATHENPIIIMSTVSDRLAAQIASMKAHLLH